jgi:hypothetical protein
MFYLFLLFHYCLSFVKLLVIPWFFSVVLLGLFISSISSCHNRTMLSFGGYRQGCASCASRSWSNLVRVICRDHCGSVCPGSFRDRMSY